MGERSAHLELYAQLQGGLTLGVATLTTGSTDRASRTQSTDTWVTFKVFGVMPLTFIFAALQYPLLTKHDASEAKK